MWYVYIIRCRNGALYTGSTTDVDRRIKEHNSRKGGNYTRLRTPVKLEHREICQCRSDAQKREEQIKRWSRQKKLALIQHNYNKLCQLSVSHD